MAIRAPDGANNGETHIKNIFEPGRRKINHYNVFGQCNSHQVTYHKLKQDDFGVFAKSVIDSEDFHRGRDSHKICKFLEDKSNLIKIECNKYIVVVCLQQKRNLDVASPNQVKLRFLQHKP